MLHRQHGLPVPRVRNAAHQRRGVGQEGVHRVLAVPDGPGVVGGPGRFGAAGKACAAFGVARPQPFPESLALLFRHGLAQRPGPGPDRRIIAGQVLPMRPELGRVGQRVVSRYVGKLRQRLAQQGGDGVDHPVLFLRREQPGHAPQLPLRVKAQVQLLHLAAEQRGVLQLQGVPAVGVGGAGGVQVRPGGAVSGGPGVFRRLEHLRIHRVGGLAGHQPAGQQGGQRQPGQRGPAPASGGQVPQLAQAVGPVPAAQRKAGGQRRGAAHAGGVEQRVAVRRAEGAALPRHHLLVAGGLDVPPRPPGQQPDSRVVPVQRAGGGQKQLEGQVMPAQVGQLVGQHQGGVRGGGACLRHQQHRPQDARRHRAAHRGAGQQTGPAAQRHGGLGVIQRLLPARPCRDRPPHRTPPPKQIGSPLPQRHRGRAGQPHGGQHFQPG